MCPLLLLAYLGHSFNTCLDAFCVTKLKYSCEGHRRKFSTSDRSRVQARTANTLATCVELVGKFASWILETLSEVDVI